MLCYTVKYVLAMMLVTTFVKFMLDSWKYYRVEVLYMPFLGIFAALLANSVPIGGGIVYIPVLHLLGTRGNSFIRYLQL